MLTRTYHGNPIRQREDGYFSLTDMAQAAGKQVNHWLSNASTREYLDALSPVTGIPGTGSVAGGGLLDTKRGGTPTEQGTWAHPLVASNFAQWCSPTFAVQVSLWVEEIRTNGYAVDARRPMDFAAIIRDPKRLPALTLQLAQLVEEQAQQLAEAAPKVEAHDRLMNADGAYSLMDAGRVLGRQPIKFINLLVADRVLFRNAHGTPEPIAEYRERGLFEVITLPVRCGEVDRPRIQTKVTPQGLTFLASRYPRTDGPAPRLLGPSPETVSAQETK